ncbi:MAG: nuclease domain-containing protein [Desulfuromonadaceae bacterium]|nr:nuclease domain-containing protein [Desulfuromonadaceae bacterium]MDD2855629.1 nuclease domain-containing protein [Desulfuromonadaceae bacterium]
MAHEPPFSVTNKPDARGIYSWTTPQKPDILLEASFPGNSRIRWIFDAKYRIASEDGNDDLIPDDAINQMHRYRDALIHLSAGDDGITEKSRPIVGAFVLYPGWFDEEAGTNPYAAAVESVGIGGFPLLPGRDNLWLKAFLKEKFGDTVRTSALDADEHRLHESVRIPPTGLKLEQYSDLTLAASLGSIAGRDRGYVNRFLEGTAGWYHLPVSTQENRKIPRSVMREVRYCAISVHQPGAHDRLIEYLYDVKLVRLVKRCELTVEQAGSLEPGNDNEYWLFELGPARQLSSPIQIGGVRPFRFRLTSSSGMLAGKPWQELEERYPGVTGKAATRASGGSAIL